MRIILYVTLFLFLNCCGSKKNIEDVKIEKTQDDSNIENAEDTRDDPDTEDDQDDSDIKDAQNTEDDSDTRDTQSTKDDPDTRDTQDTEDDQDDSNTVPTSSQPIGHIIEGKNSVKKYSEYYTSGLLVGTLLKASERGWFFDTKEVQVILGNFPSTSYVGQVMDMSIDDNDDNIFNQLLQLNPHQVYIFEYKKPHFFDREIEETRYHILNATPLNKEFGMNHTGVVKASSIEKKGSYSIGERRGKIILVQRWGMWDIDCSFTLHAEGQGYTNTPVFPDFNVYSEEGCQFAEEALKAGKDVIVKYSEDYIELWDLYSKIAEEIILVD